jgi:hypothetical protein
LVAWQYHPFVAAGRLSVPVLLAAPVPTVTTNDAVPFERVMAPVLNPDAGEIVGAVFRRSGFARLNVVAIFKVVIFVNGLMLPNCVHITFMAGVAGHGTNVPPDVFIKEVCPVLLIRARFVAVLPALKIVNPSIVVPPFPARESNHQSVFPEVASSRASPPIICRLEAPL